MNFAKTHIRLVNQFSRGRTRLNPLRKGFEKRSYRTDLLGESFFPHLARQKSDLDDRFKRGFKCATTVVFFDICQFSKRTSSLSPDAIRRILQTYYECLIPIIDKSYGVVEKCIGDGVLATFGAPFYRNLAEPDTLWALKACRDAIEQLYRLNIDARAGLCRGNAYFGYMGTGPFREPTIIGEVLTKAFRLEDLGKCHRVTLIDASPEASTAEHMVPQYKDFRGWRYYPWARFEELRGVGWTFLGEFGPVPQGS